MEVRMNSVDIKSGKAKYWIRYALCFLFVRIFSIVPLMINGLTTLGPCDAMQQYTYTLMYLGKHLRSMLNSVLSGQEISVPMCDLSLGFGGDVITTLHWNGYTNPLSLISIFFDESETWVAYEIIQVSMMFIAGVGFSLFCFYHKRSYRETLFACIAYVFSGWTLIWGTQFLQFLVPMMYLPFVLLGVDRIYEEKKYGLFIGALSLAGISNVVFFYIICFFSFFYIVVRYFHYVKHLNGLVVTKWFLRFLGSALLAIALAAVVLIPTVAVLINNGRTGIDYEYQSFFDLIYYLCIPFQLTSLQHNVGFLTIGIVPLYLVLSEKKKRSNFSIYICLILFTLLFIFPGLQALANCFSYVSYRWGFAWIMLMSYLLAKYYKGMSEIRGKKYIGIIALLCILLIIKVFLFEEMDVQVVAFLLLIGVLSLMNVKKIRSIVKEGVLWVLEIGLIVLSIWAAYGDENSGISYDTYINVEEASRGLYSTSVYGAVGDITAAQENQRVDLANKDERLTKNIGLVLGLYTTGHNFSMTTDMVSNFYNSLWINSFTNCHYYGFENKAELDSLFAVRYVISNYKKEFNETYSLIKEYGNGFWLYENRAALPLVYTYDSWMPQREWSELEPEHKQSVLLKAVVLEKESSTLIKEDYVVQDRNVKYFTTCSDGVEIIGNSIRVTKPNSSIMFTCNNTQAGELYVKIQDFVYVGNQPRLDVNLVREDNLSTITLMTPAYQEYCGKNDYMCNLGWTEEGQVSFELKLLVAGTYQFETLEVILQPVNEILDDVEKLKEDAFEDCTVDINSIRGNITIEEAKLLCVAVPYSNGWACYVNGDEKEVLKVNNVFVGVELEPGMYEIEFKYVTPYLMHGTIVSILSILGVVIYKFIVYTINKKKRSM